MSTRVRQPPRKRVIVCEFQAPGKNDSNTRSMCPKYLGRRAHTHTHTSSAVGNSYRNGPKLEVSVFKSPTSLDPRRCAGSNGCKQALSINIFIIVVP